MRRTGRFRAREEYQDLFGAGIHEREGDILITLDTISGEVFLNRLQANKDAITLRYFEPEYEWSDGKRFFKSERNPFLPVWYIKDLVNYDLGIIHSSHMWFAIQCADEVKSHKFYDTKEDALKVLQNAINNL